MPHLSITPGSLQNFDLVPIGVLHKEETRHQTTIAMELFDRIDCEAQFSETGVLAVQIIDCKCDMAVGIAVIVRFGSAQIYG